MSKILKSLKHGGFSHLKPNLRKSRQEFIDQSNVIHNNKYKYDLVIYVRNEDYVIIECPNHGYFLQSPKTHITGRGCKRCGGERRRLNTASFIEKSNAIHNLKYDYSLSEYKLYRTKIKIICKKHGIFEQTPSDHLAGSGCQECAKDMTSWSRSQYQQIANKKNGRAYIYLVSVSGENEVFYKIGITIYSVSARYWGEKDYSFSLISQIKMKACEAWDKERELKRSVKRVKYDPKHKFGGHTECFSELTQEVKDFFGITE